MKKLQLYIKGERIDLFKDEAISITQTIQNVKDIDKVFTAFTKTFNLPASKVNNKVFKHYYNFDIVGGFDARLKVNSTIELNDMPFKKGKIKLEGVDLMNGVANTYKVTFFGNTVELKDLLGEDKLNNLPLEQYNKVYSASEVLTGLKSDPNASNINVITPLITHTQRLFYDNNSHDENGNGNLYYDGGHAQNLHGVKWTDLKYALRVNKIFEAIEERYTQANGYPTNLVFSNNFINNPSLPEINQLFIWLHRKSGNVENLAGNVENEVRVLSGTYPDTDGYDPDTFTIRLTPAANSINKIYSVRVTNNAGNTWWSVNNISGVNTFDLRDNFTFEDGGSFKVYISTAVEIEFTDVYVFFEWEEDGFNSESWRSFGFIIRPDFLFDVSQQIPDMKVIDFMSGFFKMFNLTAYVDDILSNESTTHIRIEPLNDYYNTFNTYNISDYVDVKKQSVNLALPYKEVKLLYKDTKTFLANRYNQFANKSWGELSYSTNESDLDGSLYKVEIPFSHMQFERLNVGISTIETNIQYGWSVSESQSPYKGAPLLFYPNNQYLGNTSISYVNNIDTDGSFSTHTQVTTANLPSNSLQFDASISKKNINYQNEINEYTKNNDFTDTLFKEYYSDYLVDTFSLKRRLTKITAYLPLKLTIKLQLNDKIVYNEKLYRINSMTTNLLSGKTDLELLNEV